MSDVKHPSHYNSGKIETWDWIEMGLTREEYKGFLKGNMLKHLHRCELKHETVKSDLDKAKEYADKLKEFLTRDVKSNV